MSSTAVRLCQAICVAIAVSVSLAACSSTADEAPKKVSGTISVPADQATIQAAVEVAAPGATIEISPGTYEESVIINTADVTIRGTDRNDVILDGGGVKGNGIVVTSDGVEIENLTVRNYNLNGVLVTGMSDEGGGLASGSDGYTKLDPEKFPPVKGFAVRYVTASNNGLYGIYAFDSHDGVIEHNYASGHADSGIYVGQCEGCDIVVRGNVAEYNAVGYEQTNASGQVYVLSNRFANNRVGLTLMSDYREAFVPQHDSVVTGNLIAYNDAAQTPAQADGGYGIGIGISGGQANEIRANRIVGNPHAGIVVTSTEDIAPLDNQIIGNWLGDNGTDLAYTATDRAPGAGNCLADNTLTTTIPARLPKAWPCPKGAPRRVGGKLPRIKAPEGISFRDVEAGPTQPEMPDDAKGDAASPRVRIENPAVPRPSLLADLARGRE